MIKRVFTAVFFLLALSMGQVYAQDLKYEGFKTDELDAYRDATKNCDSPSLECLAKNTTRFVAMEWIHDILGQPASDAGKEEEAYLNNSSTPIATSTGLVGNMTKLIAGMYAYPPAKTSRFVADVSQSAGIQPAYAQGLGFAALDPVLDLWKKFRNVAYFFFILLFIIIGFMIMFRAKVGGQAAITAQQAIPSILISLILVTFSYAISGFLIDLMYLIMYMIIGLFGEVSNGSDVPQNLIGMNIFALGAAFLKPIVSGSGIAGTSDLIEQLLLSLGSIQEGATTGIISIISGLTLSLVLAVAMVIAIFRLFFELLKSYATIIVSVVAAPIYLMFGAIPGNNAFSGWIKSMIGNLSAFPAVLLITVLFYEFTQAGSAGSVVQKGGFMPPFLVGNGASGLAGPLLGFALLLALPDIVKAVKEKLGAKAGIGEQIAGWAGKNALRGADLGMPFGGAGFEGTRRGLVGGYAALTADKSAQPEYRGARGLWKGIREGVVTEAHGKRFVRGGAASGLSAGFRVGQQGRKVLDDLKDGRILQPDNLRAQLERIEKGGKPDKEEKDSTPKKPALNPDD